MTILMALGGLLLGALGVLLASQATQGVSLIAFGCLLAICARLAQASAHHTEAKAQWRSAPTESATQPAASPERVEPVLHT